MIIMTDETNELYTDTSIILDDETVQTITTPVYEFQLRENISPDYKCCTSIIRWIKENLDGLTDDYMKPLFSKVNYGYNQETLKGFGKKPVCDVYINNLGYTSDFDSNKPDIVNSFIICYLKGNMNNAYIKTCELTDYLVQEFEENQDFRTLDMIVRDTRILNIELQIIPNPKSYGVLCAFELEHKLY